MKKILFVIPSYKMGGTLISLRALLSFIDPQKIDADVLDLVPGGEYGYQLSNCKLIRPNVWLAYLSEGLSGPSRYVHKFLFGLRYLIKQITSYDILPFYFKVGCRLLGAQEYDTVVCYSESIAKYVCHYPIKRKIAWIHCDYSRIAEKTDEYIYDKFEKIVCVSRFGKSVFDNIWSALANRTIAIHNLIEEDYIIKMSKEINNIDGRFNNNQFTILSIGRLDAIKQFEKIPSIVSKVKEEVNKPFKWYIIGGGNEHEKRKIEDKIASYNVKEYIELLGEKGNVYPYLTKSDLFVNTSRSEAYSLVNNEAKCLGIPVLSNNFECAGETIVDGKDGRVVPLEDMPSVIVDIIKNKMKFNIGSVDNSTSIIEINKLFS